MNDKEPEATVSTEYGEDPKTIIATWENRTDEGISPRTRITRSYYDHDVKDWVTVHQYYGFQELILLHSSLGERIREIWEMHTINAS